MTPIGMGHLNFHPIPEYQADLVSLHLSAQLRPKGFNPLTRRGVRLDLVLTSPKECGYSPFDLDVVSSWHLYT